MSLSIQLLFVLVVGVILVTVTLVAVVVVVVVVVVIIIIIVIIHRYRLSVAHSRHAPESCLHARLRYAHQDARCHATSLPHPERTHASVHACMRVLACMALHASTMHFDGRQSTAGWAARLMTAAASVLSDDCRFW